MITVRPNVFETNSSSEHCLTVEDGMRDIEEFPVPDDTGTVHIPMIGNADDLCATKNFVSLVQYIVIASLKGNGYEHLFKLTEEEVSHLNYVITTAYKMAGIADVDEVVLDPPDKKDIGVTLSGGGYLALWGGCYTETDTMEWGLKSVLERLAWYVKNNNVALRLVTLYTTNKPSEHDLNYAAAALAMRTHGTFQAC